MLDSAVIRKCRIFQQIIEIVSPHRREPRPPHEFFTKRIHDDSPDRCGMLPPLLRTAVVAFEKDEDGAAADGANPVNDNESET